MDPPRARRRSRLVDSADRMVPQFAGAVSGAEAGRVHAQAGADAVRLARDPAGRHARRHAAAVRPGQAAPRADRQAKKFRAYMDELMRRTPRSRSSIDQPATPAAGAPAPAAPATTAPAAAAPAPLPHRRPRPRRRARTDPSQEAAPAWPLRARCGLQQLPRNCSLVEHRHAELLGFRELGAGSAPGDEVTGLLRDAARRPSRRARAALPAASSRVMLSRVPVSTKVLPASERPALRAAGGTSPGQCTPCARSA